MKYLHNNFEFLAPEYQAPPSVELVIATSVNITWTPPLYPNGIIENYTVTLTGGDTFELSYDDNAKATIVDDLAPFTMYDVTVTATNDRGSVTSDPARICTGEIGKG